MSSGEPLTTIPALFPNGAAIVFGGSGGIGQAAANALAAAGSPVALVYHSEPEAARQAAEAIRAKGGRATVHKADVTSAAEISSAVEEAAVAHGRLHTIVFAAGPHVEQMPLADVTPELWRRSIDTETHGLFHVFKSTVKRMRDWGGGSYLHLGSAGELWWPERDGLSVCPKAANEALIRGIAKEEGRHNIRANSILVGVIETGQFLEHLRRGTFDQAWIDAVQAMLPMKRWGKPEEIGQAAVFLATNAYVTGQQISVAGGFGI